VLVPKVESAAQVHFVAEVLADLERKRGGGRAIGIEVQIESPRGLVEIERLAVASPRIETLIFGPGDYAAAAGMPELTVGAGDPGRWHDVLARILTTACAFGLQASTASRRSISTASASPRVTRACSATTRGRFTRSDRDLQRDLRRHRTSSSVRRDPRRLSRRACWQCSSRAVRGRGTASWLSRWPSGRAAGMATERGAATDIRVPAAEQYGA
jgi:hypothetical protein